MSDNIAAPASAAQDSTLFDKSTGADPSASVYEASLIKPRRFRSTKKQVGNRRDEMLALLKAMQPMTVRQVFYQATVSGLVEKTEAGYAKIQVDLTKMRREGALPYGWLADNTRWQRKPTTFSGPIGALEARAKLYRKRLWADQGKYVEIWLEKDALAGVVFPVTERFDVPLMVARGYASLSFLHSSAEFIGNLEVPAHIFHLGDHDPSGVNAGEKIEETLRKMAPEAEIHFERLAITPQQIADWNLPSRPTKKTDPRAKKFGHAESVELDAIDPQRLRDLVAQAIIRHLPPDQFRILMTAEESERQQIGGLVAMIKELGGGARP